MDLVDLLSRWGVPLVFAGVLLEAGGLPLPGAALMVVAAALSMTGALRIESLFFAALAACLLSDHLWFVIGRVAGRRVLGTICRLSLSPETCVRQTDDLVATRGAALLVVAKFIPGVSAVAIPTVAAGHLAYRRFLLYDVAGCVLWVGAYLGLGLVFNRGVNGLLDSMSTVGGWSILAVVLLVALYVGAKLLHRRSLRRLHRLTRISPADLAELLRMDDSLVIVDARSHAARALDPRMLPRSVHLGEQPIEEALPEDWRSRTIVTFCTCPSEASAALLAEELIKKGHRRVRVLTGGEDAIDALAR
ncbi:MAG: VTT domain-containing protein [Usitatibacter sp.]